jgi:antimicrobial peptide system SdpB family protein
MLARVGQWMSQVSTRDPFTNVVGLGRSLLALGTLITLVFNPAYTLFGPTSDTTDVPNCANGAGIGLFCVAPSIETGRWICIVILLFVLCGWFPRWTAIPHWWVAFSVHNNATIADGGDQAAAVITLLLVPFALCDGRMNHWQHVEGAASLPEGRRARRFIARIALAAIGIQVAFIYFQAGVAKFGVTEWADGTALYYWLEDPGFGAPPWLKWFFDPILTHGLTVGLFTWSTALAEVALGVALFLPASYRRYLLWYAVAFHSGIAVVMGLVSFACSMIAADVLFLRPVDQPFDFQALRRVDRRVQLLRMWRRRPREAEPQPTEPERVGAAMRTRVRAPYAVPTATHLPGNRRRGSL